MTSLSCSPRPKRIVDTSNLLSFSSLVVSDSLRPHGLQHARLPCSLPSLGVYSNSCPLSHWCYLTNSSSASHFSSWPSVFPSIRVFSNELALCIRWPKYWSFSFNFSISPFSEYWGLISFRIDCLISLLSKGLSRVFSSTINRKHQFFGAQPPLWSNSHICTWLLYPIPVFRK